MTPVGKRLIIKRDETPDEKITESGLIISTSNKEKPAIGTVMFNGPSAEEVFAKDKVLFMKFAGTEVSWEGEDYLIMEEKDILAVL